MIIIMGNVWSADPSESTLKMNSVTESNKKKKTTSTIQQRKWPCDTDTYCILIKQENEWVQTITIIMNVPSVLGR